MIQNNPVSRPGVVPVIQPLAAAMTANLTAQPLFASDSVDPVGVVRALAPATTLNLTATPLTVEDTRWALALEEQIDQKNPVATADLQRYQHIADQIAQQQALLLLQRLEQPAKPLTEAEQQWCQAFEASPRPAEQSRYHALVERHLAAQNQEDGPMPVIAEELSWATYMYQRSHQGYQVKPHEQRLYQLIIARYQQP